MLVQKVIKHGHSLAVVIPVKVCQVLAIKRGALVVLHFPNPRVILLDFASRVSTPKEVQRVYKEQHHGIKIRRSKKSPSRSH